MAERNKRNEFFTAMLTGAMAGWAMPEQEREARDLIIRMWQMADMACYHDLQPEHPRDVAERWIRRNYRIIDTETTGLGADAQIVEVAIVDLKGEVLLNTLVKPAIAIPEEATAIHGITNEMVADAPAWSDVLPTVLELLGKYWITYNAEFDLRMIEQSSTLPLPQMSPFCAMRLYAEFNGEWDALRRKYKWKKLTEAATALDAWPKENIGVPHRALYDCRLTRNIILAMAGVAL